MRDHWPCLVVESFRGAGELFLDDTRRQLVRCEACNLVEHISAGAIVLADANYDGKDLYTEVQRRGGFLLTPQKRNRRTEQAMKNTSPARRAAMELWRDRPKLAWRVYRLRTQIERIFSALTCFGGGLGPLPAWVRRIDRVRRWVTAKVAIYNARVLLRIAPS